MDLMKKLYIAVLALGFVGSGLYASRVRCSFKPFPTSLHAGVRHNHALKIQAQLENGGNVNERGIGGNTLLHEAAYRGHERIVKILMEQGADPLAQNESGKIPICGVSDLAIKQLLRDAIAMRGSKRKRS